METMIQADFLSFDEADHAAREIRRRLGESVCSLRLYARTRQEEAETVEIFPFLNRNTSVQSAMPVGTFFKREFGATEKGEACRLRAGFSDREAARKAESVLRSCGGISVRLHGG